MIEFQANSRYQILTPNGYRDFSGMRKTSKSEVIELSISNGKKVKASLDHKFVIDNQIVLAQNLVVGQQLAPTILVTDISLLKGKHFLYDPTDVSSEHLFIADEIISHNCDFLTSGNTVIEPELIQYYEETYMQDPMEKRGVDSNLWVWEIPDYSRSYMVVADVARGDGADYSACHVIDVETVTQVAEYKGKLSPKEFGNVLVGLSSEYNDALLVVENASMGWSTIEQILEREYRNLYYSPKSENMTVESYMSKFENNQLVPGFVMSMKTRPLVVAKMTEYIRERLVIIKSKRLLEELRVFIWKNGRAEAQSGYNDDLIMSFCIALYIRDTALRLRQQGMDLVRAQLSSLSSINSRQPTVYSSTNLQNKNPYLIEGPNGSEDISWVL